MAVPTYLSPQRDRKQLLHPRIALAVRARRTGTIVAFPPSVARWVTERGFNPENGAREIRHVIQREVEPRLAALLLAQDPTSERMVRVRVQAGELQFDLED